MQTLDNNPPTHYQQRISTLRGMMNGDECGGSGELMMNGDESYR
jgi:hypothetical protein